jgi:hypothetical protein
VKQLAAIVFSLLLIVAQTFAVAAPMSSGASVVKRSCCGNDCQCCVSQSGAPATAPVESTAPAAAQNQLLFPPVALMCFTLPVPVDVFSPAFAAPQFRSASVPLFQRDCTFLI